MHNTFSVFHTFWTRLLKENHWGQRCQRLQIFLLYSVSSRFIYSSVTGTWEVSKYLIRDYFWSFIHSKTFTGCFAGTEMLTRQRTVAWSCWWQSGESSHWESDDTTLHPVSTACFLYRLGESGSFSMTQFLVCRAGNSGMPPGRVVRLR